MQTRQKGIVLLVSLMIFAGCGSGNLPSEADGAAIRGGSQLGWPAWGGPTHNFHVPTHGLAASWPATGPGPVWKRDLGPGYSAVVAADGRLFTLYRDGNQDVVVALRAEDGNELWNRRYDAPTLDGSVLQFGSGPNGTPLVVGDRLVTLSYSGKLHCLSVEDGTILWSHDLVPEFEATVLEFGHSASPIEHDGKIIVLVGGEQMAVVALDPTDGSLVWSSDPGTVSYATPLVIDVDGQQQLVYFSADEIIGLDVADGRRLWSHTAVNQWKNNATTPVWGDDNLLWVATQPDGGTRMLRLSQSGDGSTNVEELWADKKISIHYWNSIRIDDTVYASIGNNGSLLTAVDAATGKVLWKERGFSQANFVHTGDMTLVLDQHGNLALVRLRRTGLEVLSRATISDEKTWTVPTLVGTRLYIRDATSLQVFELASTDTPT